MLAFPRCTLRAAVWRHQERSLPACSSPKHALTATERGTQTPAIMPPLSHGPPGSRPPGSCARCTARSTAARARRRASWRSTPLSSTAPRTTRLPQRWRVPPPAYATVAVSGPGCGRCLCIWAFGQSICNEPCDNDAASGSSGCARTSAVQLSADMVSANAGKILAARSLPPACPAGRC